MQGFKRTREPRRVETATRSRLCLRKSLRRRVMGGEQLVFGRCQRAGVCLGFADDGFWTDATVTGAVDDALGELSVGLTVVAGEDVENGASHGLSALWISSVSAVLVLSSLCTLSLISNSASASL